MNTHLLDKYLDLFSRLNRHRTDEVGFRPHKPILLLALLDEVERGNIKENFVAITPELVAAFRAYWRTLVPASNMKERIFYPFRYLVGDGLWELVKDGRTLTTKEVGYPTSLNQLISLIDGGRFASDLWELLQSRIAINALRAHLLKLYFSTTQSEVNERLPPNPIEDEIARLISEAQSKFRPNMTRAKKDDGEFVRHALFPRVVKSLYNEACAVCGLAAKVGKGTIVDAAHIMPFSLFHNDDPRNGVALCKNHHWGFDAGWFTVTHEYKVLVSPKLQNELTYITSNVRLHLPIRAEYSPEPQALTWHYTHKFLK